MPTLKNGLVFRCSFIEYTYKKAFLINMADALTVSMNNCKCKCVFYYDLCRSKPMKCLRKYAYTCTSCLRLCNFYMFTTSCNHL